MEFDPVNKPIHYNQGGIECIDAIEAIMKYLWRWENKNKKQDLLKAQWYLNRLINSIKEDE